MIAKSIRMLAAARACLGLEQSEVAEITGLTAQTISKLEGGKNAPTERTVRRLRQAYEDRGIVFTTHGIEYQPYKTAILESFMDVLNDAEQCLRRGDEILLHCADERRNSPKVTEKFNKLRNKGIRIRMTCEHGNKVITGKSQDYRWIEPEMFAAGQVEVIYKDKYLFHFQEEGRDIFVMTKNKAKAKSAKKQFEYDWTNGSKIDG